MKPTSCISFCGSKGYDFAGIEYSKECFCGHTIRSQSVKTEDNECSMTCGGDSTKTCGGPNRLTIYTNDAPTVITTNPGPVGLGWTYTSCFEDSMYARTLTFHIDTPLNTVDFYTSSYRSAGYKFAGVEWSSECWCGNEILIGRVGGQSGCDMVCADNPLEYCGGSQRMNVYSFETPQASTSTAQSSTSTTSESSLPTTSTLSLSLSSVATSTAVATTHSSSFGSSSSSTSESSTTSLVSTTSTALEITTSTSESSTTLSTTVPAFTTTATVSTTSSEPHSTSTTLSATTTLSISTTTTISTTPLATTTTTTTTTTTSTTTTSLGPAIATFALRTVTSINTLANGQFIRWRVLNPNDSAFMFRSENTEYVDATFSIEPNTRRLKVGNVYVLAVISSSQVTSGQANLVGASRTYVQCTGPARLGQALQCNGETTLQSRFRFAAMGEKNFGLFLHTPQSTVVGYAPIDLMPVAV